VLKDIKMLTGVDLSLSLKEKMDILCDKIPSDNQFLTGI
jgi:hypothetical protein